MIPVCDTKAASFRKTHQQHSWFTTSVASALPNSISRSNLTKRKINGIVNKSKANSADRSPYPDCEEIKRSKLSCQWRNRNLPRLPHVLTLLVFVVVLPKGTLSVASNVPNGKLLSLLKQQEAIPHVINSFDATNSIDNLVSPKFNDLHHENAPSEHRPRMKREAYPEDELTEPFYDEGDDGMDINKRSFGNNNRARRVSMMRLKKTPSYWQYPKRMSMMRLRRDYEPLYPNVRSTRGMGNVSMLRLRRAMTAMRLKKMTQMRLKRMTQMRLKRSGMLHFGDSDEEELLKNASENKRDDEEPSPVMLEREQD